MLADYKISCRLESNIILVYLSIDVTSIKIRKYSFRDEHSPGVLNLLRERKNRLQSKLRSFC